MAVDSSDKIKGLFNWCLNQTKGYKNVSVKNFTTSWRNGLGFCAILHRYGPDFIDFNSLNPENVFENCELAFTVAEKQFGIPSLLDAKDMVAMKSPDRLCIITYLSQFYNTLAIKSPKLHRMLSSIENLENQNKLPEELSVREEENESTQSLDEEKTDNQICAICSQTIYFLEKMTISDISYHRYCYRQNQLTNLKIRNKTLERQPKSDTNQNSELNVKEDKPNQISSELSFCDNYPIIAPKPVRPPYLDIYSSERSLNNDSVKSLQNLTEDNSFNSNSSINIVSFNASSVESLSQNASDASHNLDENELLSPNKLRPSSLVNSVNSLKSSITKKRPAPPPPIPKVKQRPSLLKSTPTKKHLLNNSQEIQYPEELNPFADEEDTTPSKTSPQKQELSTNPFADYMTEDIPITITKPAVRPHKRKAPKLPERVSLGTSSKSNESMTEVDDTKKTFDTLSSDKNIPEHKETDIIVSIPAVEMKNDLIEDKDKDQKDDLIKDKDNDQKDDLIKDKDNDQKDDLIKDKVNDQKDDLIKDKDKDQKDDLTEDKVNDQKDDLIKDKDNDQKNDLIEDNNNDLKKDLIGDKSNDLKDVNTDQNSESIMKDSNVSLPDKVENAYNETKIDSDLSLPVKLENPPDVVNTHSNLSSPKIPEDYSVKVEITNDASFDKSFSQSEEISEKSDLCSPDIVSKLENISIDQVNSTMNHSSLSPEKKVRNNRLMSNKCKSQDFLNVSISKRRSVLKAPAPARPMPPKREVRGDTSYEFIPYESLYSQLKELNEKQSQIEIEGRSLQNTLWEADQRNEKFEEMLQTWLDLVHKKNKLFAKETELHDILKRQELEDRHSDLEYELRLIMEKQESLKTPAEKAREEELIAQILDTVNARAQLIEKNDEILQSPLAEAPKSKNTLKSFFSMKRRSSSVGKIQSRRSRTFKFGKKNK